MLSVPVGISCHFIYANICKMAFVSFQGRINKVILRVEMGRVMLINVAVILQLNFAGENDA